VGGDVKFKEHIEKFLANGGVGRDPFAEIYDERRKNWSLFSKSLSDAEMELVRPYIFSYEKLPETSADPPISSLNFIGGEWRAAESGEFVEMKSHFNRRVALTKLARSGEADGRRAVDAAYKFWESLAWADEILTYRKWVVKNFSRLLHYFSEECLREIRHQIPKTRLEAEKDFWEAKRAADHLEGAAERAMLAEQFPPMISGHSYWKNNFLPAGVVAIITPMNFIYGIPCIQLCGAYLAGCPIIFKGHPFAAITNTTLVRMLLASGADPRAIQKIEGIGREITSLTADPRVTLVSVTGSSETAHAIQQKRGVKPLRFEGGGVNWAWVDDNFSDDELRKIAARLTYSKLALSSHKCTGLHGVAASVPTLRRIEPMFVEEFKKWSVEDPRKTESSAVVGPVMVHKATNVDQIVAEAQKAGCKILLEGRALSDSEYTRNAEVASPAIISGVRPDTTVTIDWDGKGKKTFPLAKTELFLPVLVTMEADFDRFLRFSLLENPHDLATSLYSRDDAKLQKARKILGGMLKENDGTDAALEWEAFGASGVTESGNTGVGDAVETLRMFCRAQKGRHVEF
jgi:acyl-CoA reductase-like NAD-dependent aldehyde dehydrogenase